MRRREFNQLLAAAVTATPGRLASDRHRPQYHFLAKANWMNDPNGPVYYRGTYHMFFQWGPGEPLAKPNKRLWGHAISKDMVHWKHMPIALDIQPEGIESKGVWSGSVVIADGVPTALYTGGGGQHLATSDDDMVVWKRYEGNPIVKKPPAGMELSGWRDPAVWKESDGWYMLIGAGYKEKYGTALLYRSQDLRNWEYLHPLLTGSAEERPRPDITRGEDMWECPDFFPLGDRHVMIASIIGFPPKGWYTRVPYWIGKYANHEFKVERTGETDHGWAYASKTMADARGRRIYWAWIRERRPSEQILAAGWAGVMSLPRVLTLREDGALGIEPLPELKMLRGKRTKIGPAEIGGEEALIKDVQGDSLEIVAEFDQTDAAQYGIRVRCSPDGKEEYRIGYDAARQAVVAGSQAAPIGKGERLRIHAFVDASVIEVFVNGRVCIADRFYPVGTESLGVGLYASGGKARLRSLEVWRINPISSDRLTS